MDGLLGRSGGGVEIAVNMDGFLGRSGGGKGYVGPLSNYWGDCPPPSLAPPLPTPMY